MLQAVGKRFEVQYFCGGEETVPPICTQVLQWYIGVFGCQGSFRCLKNRFNRACSLEVLLYKLDTVNFGI
ncbi:hypothetical protein CEXT_493151 [Caerostris extrusa]|uniref:Uncharacterized protein n=1 Tax=Caerostris extrusa TaxID=172846 RepID=A0AAV4S2L2_CAEEX|nr:hypothetical protein CEXT_493151 [Caerostris extrusa]